MSEADERPDLGAFLLAIGWLEPDEAVARKIARLFRIQIQEPTPPAPGADAQPAQPATSVDTPSIATRPTSISTPPVTPQPIEPIDDEPPPVTGEVQPLVAVRKQGPSLAPVQTDRALPAAARWTAQELPFQPLLRPIATRAIIGSALAQRSAGGPLDVERLVELMARRHPIVEVPRLPRWSIAGRTLVLVDRGAGMAPFARDAGDFSERIASVASRDRTDIRRFWRTPRLVGNSPTTAKELDAPPRGTAVIALTDLGIAPGAPEGVVDDWLAFAGRMASAGCSLVVFVPYPPSRWPAPLAEKLALVTWDRSTSLAAVLATVHPAHPQNRRSGA